MSYDMQDFQTDVLEQSQQIPILVDFWADWCAPCKVLGPVLENLAKQNQDRWKLVKVNTEHFPEIAGHFGIRSIPNVKLFVEGQIVDEFSGALPEHAIVEWLQKAIPSPRNDQLEQAKMLLAAQQIPQAKQRLQTVIQADPEEEEARVLLAQITIYSDNPREQEDALALVQGIENDSKLVQIAESIQWFGKLFQANYQKQLPENPIKPTFLAGLHCLQKQQFSEALEHFIEVIRKERGYAAEGARKTCIAIFKYLGEGHEISKKYRPIFSSAFYI